MALTLALILCHVETCLWQSNVNAHPLRFKSDADARATRDTSIPRLACETGRTRADKGLGHSSASPLYITMN